MDVTKERYTTKKALFILILLSLPCVSFSQVNDSTKVTGHFGGAVTLTNNGISFIPNFTLGKPAAIFDMSVGKRNLSFEPQFRFALEGKPWSFVFWWRYKLLKTDKFQINIGGHPAIAFKTIDRSYNDILKEEIVAQRFLAGELSPNFSLTKKINAGIYYFYAYGFEKDATKNTQLISLRSTFSNIRISNQLFMKLAPQLYYLRMDDKGGYYFSSSLTLAKSNFPLSVSALVNKTIKTNIPIGEDFIWNISLIYTFNKDYIEKWNQAFQ